MIGPVLAVVLWMGRVVLQGPQDRVRYRGRRRDVVPRGPESIFVRHVIDTDLLPLRRRVRIAAVHLVGVDVLLPARFLLRDAVRRGVAETHQSTPITALSDLTNLLTIAPIKSETACSRY